MMRNLCLIKSSKLEQTFVWSDAKQPGTLDRIQQEFVDIKDMKLVVKSQESKSQL